MFREKFCDVGGSPGSCTFSCYQQLNKYSVIKAKIDGSYYDGGKAIGVFHAG
jgi:hypothetical protein|tara:strand:- start:1806 stop:1961 length:156 start_codon:yes stop_codon:yes gene_type:complete